MSRRIKVGLNGFGRIGRAFARVALLKNTFDIAVINTRKTPTEMMRYLLQYDSVYRKFEKQIDQQDKNLVIDTIPIATTQNPEVNSIPWADHNVDIVVDATGAYTTSEELKKHLNGSVKKVILTSPSKDDETPHIVLGVNDKDFDYQNSVVISNCSCTTNCASPLLKVLHDQFRIKQAEITTIHAMTLTQSLLDDTGKSFDRSRSALLNIVPSTSGASRAVAKTIPDLKGKLEVASIRVPVPVVSLCDTTVVVEKSTTVEEIHNAYKIASETTMKGILQYQTETLVSSDYIANPFSCIYDANYTKIIGGTMVKVMGWYDNEWSYSSRLVDLVERLSHFV